MAVIGLKEARPGMVLARDVVDRTGRLLLSAHHPVTDRTLKIFAMWGVTELAVEDVDEPADDQAPAAALDPALLGQAQATTDDLFRHANREHPWVAELHRLSTLLVARRLADSP